VVAQPPTATPTNTDTPTATPTNTDTPTTTPKNTVTPPTPGPLELAQTPVVHNRDWTPVYETFNGVEMALVPAGCFMMGSYDGVDDEQPVTEICFSEPFWIDRTEITNGQYGSSGRFSGDNRPREMVTWFEARDFCASRGARLPTEAEWEYAARGPEGWVYPWGNEFVADNAVWGYNSGDQTADVGSRPAGASWVGAVDLSGNVWEWVSSLYRPYPYNVDDGRENDEDVHSARVLRGGSWGTLGGVLRVAFRLRLEPTLGYSNLGFRCVRPF
jgi:formylglycine-generating enzyme required for sulfatase activity